MWPLRTNRLVYTVHIILLSNMVVQIIRYSSLPSRNVVSGVFIHPVIEALIHIKSSTLIYKYPSIDGLGGTLPRFSLRGGRLGDGSLVSLVFNVALSLSPPLLLDHTLGILSREGGSNGATLFLVELLLLSRSIELDRPAPEIDPSVAGEEPKYEAASRFFPGKGDKEVNTECGWSEGLDEGRRREERRKVKSSPTSRSNW